jgi:hypothetical protein
VATDSAADAAGPSRRQGCEIGVLLPVTPLRWIAGAGGSRRSVAACRRVTRSSLVIAI